VITFTQTHEAHTEGEHMPFLQVTHTPIHIHTYTHTYTHTKTHTKTHTHTGGKGTISHLHLNVLSCLSACFVNQ